MATFFTTVGQQWLTDVFDGTVTPGTHQVGAGTGAGAASVGSTALSTEISEGRVNATKSQPTARTNRVVGTITFTGSKTVTNLGWFAEDTTLLVHADGFSQAFTNGQQGEITIDLLHKDNSE